MSEFKGTPGEWVLDIPADGRASLVIRSAKPIVEGATMPVVVAKLDRSRRCKRLLPDARLLTAAPELYAACALGLEMLTVAVREGLDPSTPPEEVEEILSGHVGLSRLRTALAKARGV